jgi:hypothetical protein
LEIQIIKRMIKKQNKAKHYQTSDLLICSVLVYFSHTLSAIDKADSSRCIFAIKKTGNTDKLLNDFYNNRLLIEPNKFQAIQKDIKRRIYN